MADGWLWVAAAANHGPIASRQLVFGNAEHEHEHRAKSLVEIAAVAGPLGGGRQLAEMRDQLLAPIGT